MPRAARIDIPGLIYHVTNRGVKQLPIFHYDRDRQQFLRFLSRTCLKFPFRLHAYCLMTNHYHLLLQTLEGSLSQTMHYFNSLFAGWFNDRYKEVGHIFQGRFHSIPVEEDAYFKVVSRYIHLNPVRAGMVKRPEDYPWSNYSRLIRGEPDGLVDPQFLLDYFMGDPSARREKYKRFVEEGMIQPEPITESALRRMRFWGRPPHTFTLLRPGLPQQPR
jgi:putative transposase